MEKERPLGGGVEQTSSVERFCKADGQVETTVTVKSWKAAGPEPNWLELSLSPSRAND